MKKLRFVEVSGFLNKGSKGTFVNGIIFHFLNSELRQYIPEGKKLVADGNYGDVLGATIENFQIAQGLRDVDQHCGPETQTAIKKALNIEKIIALLEKGEPVVTKVVQPDGSEIVINHITEHVFNLASFPRRRGIL